MINKLLTFAFAVVAAFSLQAQTNLVRNPSFEATNTCAIGYWGIDTLWFDDPAAYRTSRYWMSPNNESPDYYNGCQSDGLELSVPTNWQGYQDAHTGQAYMGIAVYAINPVSHPGAEFREYIQTKLAKKLEPGALYCGTFYISLTYYNGYNFNATAIGNMGMALTKTPPHNDNPPVLQVAGSHTAILLTPQIEQQTAISRDTGVWQMVQGLYKAQGGEEWLTIGNFRNSANTDTAVVRPATDIASQPIFFAYYYIDDVSLEKVSEPVFTSHDTAICQFPSQIIAGSDFDHYYWSTGDTTRTIEINGPGKYWVKVRLENCGEVTDTIRVVAVDPVSLQVRDTIVCPGELPVKLTGPAGFSQYNWSDGQTGVNATFWEAGNYSLSAKSVCGILQDSFSINEAQEVPDFDLGELIDICQEEHNVPIEVAPSVALPNYLWSDGSQKSYLTVTNPGHYWLVSRSECGEKKDSVEVVGCPPQLYIPNVFSPNDDGNNDFFTVFGRSITDVTVSVFSRWGEKVYEESGESLKGWDGMFRGRTSPAGVYIYQVTYRSAEADQPVHQSGSVLLVR